MRSPRFSPAVAILSLVACSGGASLSAPIDSLELRRGFYSAQQSDRGRQSYDEVCRECHFLSDFRGRDFEWKWRRQTVWNLYREVSETMPEDKPGELLPATVVDIIAYILSLNDYQVGSADLSTSRAELEEIALGAGVPKTRMKE